ncbi:MAG: hypothetical protein ACI4UK_04150 [Floccifex sp.]
MTFEGAIIGKSGKYKNLCLELKNDIEVFVSENIDFNFYKMNNPICGIFYDVQNEIYCINVYQNNHIYLESGLPLGMNRQYHFKRKEIIVLDTLEFELA